MRLIERRIGLLFAGFLVAFLLVVCRAFWLQGVEASTLSSQALDQQTQTVMVPGLRGAILDRNGTRLASSEDAATIEAARRFRAAHRAHRPWLRGPIMPRVDPHWFVLSNLQHFEG